MPRRCVVRRPGRQWGGGGCTSRATQRCPAGGRCVCTPSRSSPPPPLPFGHRSQPDDEPPPMNPPTDRLSPFAERQAAPNPTAAGTWKRNNIAGGVPTRPRPRWIRLAF
uniref:Uncharacterized protein n=1 Tax=Triticum urartu TaxID=4572 RepID=A0A8R7V6U3_TRIUA